MSPDPDDFARRWIASWNARDLEAILFHYAEEVVFLSPYARRATGAGRVEGKRSLADYWAGALRRQPELRFTLVEALAGEDCLTLLYRNHRGELAAETLVFDAEGRATFSAACYGPGSWARGEGPRPADQ